MYVQYNTTLNSASRRVATYKYMYLVSAFALLYFTLLFKLN